MTFATYTNITYYTDWIRSEASLYFNSTTNQTVGGNGELLPPSWTQISSAKPPPTGSGSSGQAVPIIPVMIGLIIAFAFQVGLAYMLASSG